MADSYGYHFKRNFLLAYPVILSQLGHIMVGVADSMMVGQLGATPLAAATLANSIFTLFFMFGIGVSYAITPLVATADAEKNTGRIAAVLKHGFGINMLTAVLLLGLTMIASQILGVLNEDKEVVTLAGPYLIIIATSIFPFMIFQTFRQFAEGLSMTRQAMFITVTSNLINILLNYIFIFGKLGFEPMGLNGAGLATLISRIIMGIWMALYIYKNKRFKAYWEGFSFKQYSRQIINRLLKIGLPSGFQFILEIGAFGASAIMIGWVGTKSMAAHNVAINLASISWMMASGLASAIAIRVSNQLGKKDIPTLRTAGFTIFIMALILMTIWAGIFVVGRFYLPTLYISDPEVIELASSLLIIAAFFQLSDGIQVVALGALRGLSDTKIPTLFTFIAYWVLGLPIGYVLAFIFDLGAAGVWYGLLIGLTVVATTLFFRFNTLTLKILGKN
ncbi:MAG: MATE family efflux transporter [Bacteroidota bacterium]